MTVAEANMSATLRAEASRRVTLTGENKWESMVEESRWLIGAGTQQANEERGLEENMKLMAENHMRPHCGT